MRLSRPFYESLPVLYVLAGVVLLGVSYHLHTGSISVLLMIVGVLSLIGGAAIWLRRRDFRAADAQYPSRSGDASGDDDAGLR
jgi:LPXTG-motif cell wall-anchored protein